MATVLGNSGASTWMELSWYWPTSESQVAGISWGTSQIAVFLTSGSRIDYNGTFDPSFSTGTISSIEVYLGTVPAFEVTGLSYSLSTWMSSSFDQDIPSVMSGADTVVGSAG